MVIVYGLMAVSGLKCAAALCECAWSYAYERPYRVCELTLSIRVCTVHGIVCVRVFVSCVALARVSCPGLRFYSAWDPLPCSYRAARAGRP